MKTKKTKNCIFVLVLLLLLLLFITSCGTISESEPERNYSAEVEQSIKGDDVADISLSVFYMGKKDKIPFATLGKYDYMYYFDKSEGIGTIGVSIRNKTDNPITVNWSKSSIDANNIVINGQKVDEKIVPSVTIAGNQNMYERIMSSNQNVDFRRDTYSEFWSTNISVYRDNTLLLCIEHDNGQETYYTFTIKSISK